MLEKLGYTMEGNGYIKHIDNYKILLMRIDKDLFVRRIQQDNRVIDIRQVGFHNLETDKVFMDMLRNRAATLDNEVRRFNVEETPQIKTEFKIEPILEEPEVDITRWINENN